MQTSHVSDVWSFPRSCRYLAKIMDDVEAQRVVIVKDLNMAIPYDLYFEPLLKDRREGV